MKKLFMILPFALILCFMVGCQDKATMAELEEFRAQAAVEEQNKELVIRFYEEIDKQNFDAAIEMLACYSSPSNSLPHSKHLWIGISSSIGRPEAVTPTVILL